MALQSGEWSGAEGVEAVVSVSSCRTGDALTAYRNCMWDGRVGSDDRVGRICRSGQNYPMRSAMCKSEIDTQNWRAKEKPVVEATVLTGGTVASGVMIGSAESAGRGSIIRCGRQCVNQKPRHKIGEREKNL